MEISLKHLQTEGILCPDCEQGLVPPTDRIADLALPMLVECKHCGKFYNVDKCGASLCVDTAV